MNSFEMKKWKPPRLVAGVDKNTMRHALHWPDIAIAEARKVSFAVEDVLVMASFPIGQIQFDSFLPVTKDRVHVAEEAIEGKYGKVVQDIVVYPLVKQLGPYSGNKWYDRINTAGRIAAVHPTLIAGYEAYELQQEFTQRREINRWVTEFVNSFLQSGKDVAILQERLEGVFRFGNIFPSHLPLDQWIQQELVVLQQLSVGDLRFIASHPTGKKLLKLYELFDRLYASAMQQSV